MNLLLTSAAAGQSSIIMVVAYVVIIAAFFYFAMVRPQKKERQRMQALYESLAVGDSILTNSGFYGVVIDISDDTVIVLHADATAGRIYVI